MSCKYTTILFQKIKQSRLNENNCKKAQLSKTEMRKKKKKGNLICPNRLKELHL